MKTNAAAIGIVLGIIFALVQVSSSQRLSDEVLVIAYAAVLVLVTMAFLPSMRWGLVSGVVAVVCEPMGEFVYYSLVYGTGIAAGMVPYSALFLPRIVVLPLSGMLGGAIAAEYHPKPERAQRRQKKVQGCGRREVRSRAGVGRARDGR